MLKKVKTIIILLLISVLILISGIVFLDLQVKNASKNKLFYSTKKIPYNRVGVLLGTSKRLINGRINLYYKYRIQAAVKIFRSGKIDYILVSGDNRTKSYDEPTTIKKDLIAMGIPKNKIFLDYAGLRTLDSILRSREIFGQNNITVISQPFHNERALFIARSKNINAVGFNARDVRAPYGMKTKIREKFARVRMILDLLFGVQPKYLGEKVIIK